jgi:hypothetical protein
MDSFAPQSSPADDPTSAFEALRGEVSLLRRAVEGLTAERQSAPDYTPTLNATAKRLGEIGAFMQAVAEQPAIKLTPKSLTAEITEASATVRAEDRKLIENARGAFDAKVKQIDACFARARAAQEQDAKVFTTGCLVFIISALFWMILPGIVARSLPTSWHVPERIAARIMRLDMKPAGRRLLYLANGSSASDSRRNSVVPKGTNE